MEPVPALETCPSCGARRPEVYCGRCGEKRSRPEDLKLGHFLGEIFHFHTHLDNKVVRTLGTLIRRPGELTQAWIEGRRVGYAKPIQLFVILNLLFFLIAPRLGALRWDLQWLLANQAPDTPFALAVEARRAALGVDLPTLARHFAQVQAGYKRGLMMFMIPGFTAGLWLVVRRRRLVEHLVFAIHYGTWLFLLILGFFAGIIALVLALRPFGVRWDTVDPVFIPVTFLAMTAYLHPALRRVYGGGRALTLARALFIAALFFLLFLPFQALVLNLALRSL